MKYALAIAVLMATLGGCSPPPEEPVTQIKQATVLGSWPFRDCFLYPSICNAYPPPNGYIVLHFGDQNTALPTLFLNLYEVGGFYAVDNLDSYVTPWGSKIQIVRQGYGVASNWYNLTNRPNQNPRVEPCHSAPCYYMPMTGMGIWYVYGGTPIWPMSERIQSFDARLF